MTARNDTTPDSMPGMTGGAGRTGTLGMADTEPGAAPLEATPRKGTDPTWPPLTAKTPARVHDSVPGADALLAGIEARPPVEATTQAESAGRDAADYAAVVIPPKPYVPTEAPAVVVAITEPLPIPLPVVPAPVAQPRKPDVRAQRSQARRAVTTVPGLHRVRFSRRNLAIAVVSILAAASVTVGLLHLRGSAAAERMDLRVPSAGVSTSPLPLPKASAAAPPLPASPATPSSPSTQAAPAATSSTRSVHAISSAAPTTPKPAVAPQPAVPSATHEPAPARTPEPKRSPPANSDLPEGP